MDDEAEEQYESDADYLEEEEDLDLEEDSDDEEGDAEIDYEAEIDEIEKIELNNQPIIQKINELDNNHRIIWIRPRHLCVSSHIIQFSELVEAIGVRISQIEWGSPIFTDVSGYTNSISMAKKEFIDRQNPLTLVREMKADETEIIVEEFPVRFMTFPITDKEILSVTEKDIKELLTNQKSKFKY